jgi:hypothetical protein
MEFERHYNSIEEVLEVAKSAEGKLVKEFDVNNRLESKKNKGGIGQIIEEGLFQRAVNSRAEADFANLDLELKVTGLKSNAKQTSFSAKERLVLNIIDYMEEYKHIFEESSLWHKNKNILIMFYQWIDEISKGDFPILKSVIHQFTDADLAVVKQDWQIIIDKIKAGKAHEISESDTMYLAACTKGANAKSMRQQPFSDIPAKQRAYSLKSSYMTAYARRILMDEDVISVFKPEELQSKSVEALLQERFAPYIGRTIYELKKHINLAENKNKAMYANLISDLLGIKGTNLDDTEEFAKANIKFKTIRLEPNGVPREHMSFEQIDFDRWLDASWEESQVYETFENTKFLFVVFQFTEAERENPNRVPYLKGIKLWNMPEQVIETELKDLWKTVHDILEAGVELTQTPRGVKNNLPGSKFNRVCHIRPKAANAADKVQLPDGQMITKQTYWLNREYIAEIVREL